MAITNISRDWGIDPSIVRIVTTDNLATITTAGYLTAQDANIVALNNGEFEWKASDYALIYYSNGEGFFTRDATTLAFVAAPASPGSLSNTLPHNDVFVGSVGNIATGVPMTGDVAIADTGATTIQALAVTTGKLANGAVTSAKLDATTLQYVAVPMTAAQINGMYAAPFQLVAAGGANTQFIVHHAEFVMTFVTTQFAAGGAIAIQLDNTVHGAGVLMSGTVAAATLNGFAASSSVGFEGVSTAGTLAAKANKGLFISNQTGAFTTGDSTAVVHLWYSKVPTV